MELEKFVMISLKKGKRFGSTSNEFSFDNRKKLADLTKHVDYDCGFGSTGRCKNYLETPAEQLTMCCCNSCFDSMGYVDYLPTGDGGWPYDQKDNLKDLKVYARHFSEKAVKFSYGYTIKIGYWRPGKGCILPRSYRSNTCLGYTCGKKKQTKWERRLFQLLHRRTLSFPVKIAGIKRTTYNGVVDAMITWRKKIDDKNKGN